MIPTPSSAQHPIMTHSDEEAAKNDRIDGNNDPINDDGDGSLELIPEICPIFTVGHVVTGRWKRIEGTKKPSSKGMFWHNVGMTTKTIPEYLEDEGRKLTEIQLRTEDEAARIQAAHHTHHRTAKQPKTEAPRQPKTAVKTKTAGARKKTPVIRKAAKKARKSRRK
jgi:hypothetical protein